jgi:excisionase family DNA binding protein
MSSNIRLDRACEECNKIFVAKTTVTRFCSLRCNSKNYKNKTKQGKIALSNEQTQKVIEAPIRLINEMDYLTLTNTCKLLNVSRTTLWRLIKNNVLNTYAIGGKTIIKRIDIDNLFNK